MFNLYQNSLTFGQKICIKSYHSIILLVNSYSECGWPLGRMYFQNIKVLISELVVATFRVHNDSEVGDITPLCNFKKYNRSGSRVIIISTA